MQEKTCSLWRTQSKQACEIAGSRETCANRRCEKNWSKKDHLLSAADCLLGMVGAAQEMDSAHAKRHPPAQLDMWAKVCARCCYLKWVRTRKGKRLPVWLSPKPSFMQGAWGLGCTFCAAGRHSVQVQAILRNNKDVARYGKWSRYEQRHFLSFEDMTKASDQHASGDMHRLSRTVFHSCMGHFDCSSDPRTMPSPCL